MNRKEALCLQLRNQTTRDKETYCKVYRKKFRGYLRHVFINYQTIGLFILMAFISLFIVFDNKKWQIESALLSNICYVLLGITIFFYLCKIIKGLWFWKYAKYVVVTNEGIWIMWCGVFWKQQDFTGKKRLFSPRWTLYSWNSIKITTDDKVRPRSPVKLAIFFDNFDYAVIKSSHLTSLFVKRWDGMERIDFLEENDANEIVEYAREWRRNKRRRKNNETSGGEHDDTPDEEVENDEN